MKKKKKKSKFFFNLTQTLAYWLKQWTCNMLWELFSTAKYTIQVHFFGRIVCILYLLDRQLFELISYKHFMKKK